MAFQQPQRHQPRQASWSATAPPALETSLQPSPPRPQQSPLDDNQEWVLFSPDTPEAAHTGTTSTRTPGRSRLSDFGSLETGAVSEQAIEEEEERADAEDETEDLDSLDDGLHAFNDPPGFSAQRRAVDQSAETVLPTHDGLGMFPGTSSPVQEQFWQHEKYNPKRRRYSLRRASLQRKFGAVEDDEGHGQDQQEDRFQRIEEWRMEQSRAILEEIERETRRRRRRSRLSAARASRSQSETPARVESTPPKPASSETPNPTPTPPKSDERESFWARFTRKVIRDLMGFDDATLSYIFGEALPADTTSPTIPTAQEMIDHAEKTVPDNVQLTRTGDSWEDRFLVRIARELGTLVHHFSAHPGAFSTYLKTQEEIPYAGIIPSQIFDESAKPGRASSAPPQSLTDPTSTGAHFAPTLEAGQPRQQSAATTDPSLWGIEEEDEEDMPSPGFGSAGHIPSGREEKAQLQREREYWERDLDVSMVYGYFKSRISSSSSSRTRHQARPQTTAATTGMAATSASTNANASTAQDRNSLRRAALIRQHHPLVSRNYEAQLQTRRPSSGSNGNGGGGVGAGGALEQQIPSPVSPVLGRRQSCDDAAAASSCASQSTKRSKTGHSGSMGSRNYWDWDIGGAGPGSVGSAVLSSPGWGEV